MNGHHGRHCRIGCPCGKGKVLPESEASLTPEPTPSPEGDDQMPPIPESLRWRVAQAALDAARAAEGYAEDYRAHGNLDSDVRRCEEEVGDIHRWRGWWLRQQST